mgnify:CR=1 FL=1
MPGFWFVHSWLALAAVPIAAAVIGVHLLNRARARPMRWAAMQFLLAAAAQSRRRLRLERWLLIVLRTAMLVLLALFVARPIVQEFGLGTRAGDTGALLVVLDNGLAMQAPSAEPAKPLLADALDAALPVVHGWNGPVAVVPGVGEGTVQWLERPELAEAALERVCSTAGRADWDRLLTRIKEVLGESREPAGRRTVLVMTSLTHGNWPKPELLSQSLRQLKGSVGRVVLADLQPADRNNVTVADLEVESAFAGRDLPVRAAVGIVNRSTEPASNLKVIWNVDGREVRQDDLSEVAAGSQRNIAADLPMLAAGEHSVSVRLVGQADALKADDQRWASVAVPQRRRIVLVEPDPTGAPSSRASLFVAAVLTSASEQSASPLEIDTVAPSALQAALVEPADVVMLCDAGALAAADWQSLRQFVARGSGLVAWLGPRSVNALAGQVIDVLPAVLGGRQSAEPRSAWPVQLAMPIRPAFLDLADGSGAAGESLGLVQSLVKVQPTAGAQVLAQTATGLPVVVLRQAGPARSVLVATSPDLSWANLAGQPAFPAFVLGLLREALGRPADGTQVECGEPIRLVLSGGQVSQGRWVKPDGSSEPARISLDAGVAAAVLPVAGIPGAYQLEADGAGRTAYANADSLAGDLRAMPESGRQRLRETGIELIGGTDLSKALAAGNADDGSGRLAYLVLVLLLVEIVLTGVFTRARVS